MVGTQKLALGCQMVKTLLVPVKEVWRLSCKVLGQCLDNSNVLIDSTIAYIMIKGGVPIRSRAALRKGRRLASRGAALSLNI